jgi:UDP-glucose 4-epimerase
MTTKRAIVTGGSGFVGANLVRRLLHDGHDVHLLLRKPCQSWRLDEIAGSFCLHEADLQDGDAVGKVIGKVRPEWVFNLAAYGAYPYQTGIERMAAVNLTGCAALLDACMGCGVEAFVQTGSSSEYGYKDHPAVEDETLAPNSHYATTKAAATHYCQLVAREYNVHAVTLRLYSIYGPYEEPTRLIPSLIVHGFEGKLPPLVSPNTARDFVYVDDAVDAMLLVAARMTLPRGSVYNVCTGRQTTLESVVREVRTILQVAAEPLWSTMPQRSWDTAVWVGSPDALKRDTGWHACHSLQAGIKKTVDWFGQSPERLQFYARWNSDSAGRAGNADSSHAD